MDDAQHKLLEWVSNRRLSPIFLEQLRRGENLGIDIYSLGQGDFAYGPLEPLKFHGDKQIWLDVWGVPKPINTLSNAALVMERVNWSVRLRIFTPIADNIGHFHAV